MLQAEHWPASTHIILSKFAHWFARDRLTMIRDETGLDPRCSGGSLARRRRGLAQRCRGPSSLRSATRSAPIPPTPRWPLPPARGLYENRGLGPAQPRHRARQPRRRLKNARAATKKPSPTSAAPSSSNSDNSQYYCQRGDARVRTTPTTRRSPTTPRRYGQSPRLLWGYYGRGQALPRAGQCVAGDRRFQRSATSQARGDQRARAARPRQQPRQDIRRGHHRPDGGTRAIRRSSSAAAEGAQPLIFTQRAFALAKADRATEARTDIDEALRLAPKAAFTIAVAGLVDEKQGRMSEARDAYRPGTRHRARIKFWPSQGSIGSARRTTAASSEDPSRRRSPNPSRARPSHRATAIRVPSTSLRSAGR